MKSHAKKLGEECKSRARKRWGLGWPMLSRELQEGAVAKEVLSVLLSQPKDSSDAMTHIQEVAHTAIYGD